MVRSPRVETSILRVFPISGTKILVFCKLGYLRFLPVGLNLVARVRLEYPPPTIELFLVIAHVFISVPKCYHRVYSLSSIMQGIDIIFYIAVLIMSVVIHEISHGYAAEYFGDKTARYAGRLTLNPLRHLDPFGSVILPLILFISNAGFMIGWAKPVPYNPENLSNRRLGTLVIAFAGILANLGIALIFGVLLRVVYNFGFWDPSLFFIAGLIVIMNVALAFFNLMPFPPLDGSKILFSLLPARFARYEYILEQYSIIIFIIFLFFVWELVAPAIPFIARLLAGPALGVF